MKNQSHCSTGVQIPCGAAPPGGPGGRQCPIRVCGARGLSHPCGAVEEGGAAAGPQGQVGFAITLMFAILNSDTIMTSRTGGGISSALL